MYTHSFRELSAQQWAGTGSEFRLVAIPFFQSKRRLQMNKFRFTIKVMAFAIFTFAFATVAQAQATRTWVSGVGDDVNPCSRTAPCKTFAGAISKTAKDGEIDALDDAGYGAVTITKSITIDGGGHLASVLAAGTNGVIINVTDVNDIRKTVRLRNLSINGAGTGFDGIRVLAANKVYIESCQSFGFTGNGTNSDGLEIAVTASATVSVKDSLFENNSGDGIRQGATGGTLNCSYDNVVLAGNVNGLDATGGTANISRSVAFNNTGSGLATATNAVMNASSNQVIANGNGFNAVSPSTMRLSDNNIYRNTTGIAGGGTYATFGNNHLLGNTTDGTLPAATTPK
jgi:hypothetical protein